MSDISKKLDLTLKKINLIDENNKLLQLKKSQLLAIFQALNKICNRKVISLFTHRLSDAELNHIIDVVDEACDPKNLNKCITDLNQISDMLQEKSKTNKNLSKRFLSLSYTLMMIGFVALSISIALPPTLPIMLAVLVVSGLSILFGGLLSPLEQIAIDKNRKDQVNLLNQIGLFKKARFVEKLDELLELHQFDCAAEIKLENFDEYDKDIAKRDEFLKKYQRRANLLESEPAPASHSLLN